ncbi:cystathionine gamma-synthase [Propionibacterium freudenreichii]|uniref:cystathionine gamma-synthase n=1 Tax=Propionibacterium freudenreichii TaxID=1744 RepID=UPI0005428FDC|nr:cystathionine gamma-synthase [Propionibacterium freudenreichii]MCT2979590.1 cystathionine gamma-synthase [Propionibacterium freudenreichii]MDK9643438.1 cystathionine gamma-synthase [Propionibacterium freudenreichii]CEG86391.1 Cystathionine gamma-synthase (O-succinylhomoserine (thiol)-lyase) [Propionibacterium freudenreichii]CEI28335.1 Cystathionine gamma-synthase (O-succinylhomoserine (thiol)-lyase) [Propionibacterium freudenreichii]
MSDQSGKDPSPELSALTRAVRAGLDTDTQFGSVVPALYPSTNYRFPSIDERPPFDYSRSANPTRAMLATTLATMEHGVTATVTGSGLGAITATVEALTGPRGRVVAPTDCYGGTWRLLDHLATKQRIDVEFVDMWDLDEAARALATPAELVFVETPSNPLMRITDVAAVARLAHTAGATVVADNTFCSPLLQNPLTLGADVVVHSTTKFINGHSDVVGGAVISKTAETGELVAHWANALGLTGGAWDSWLTLRGLRTIDARMRVHQANAAAVVELLSNHPAVQAVYYPGLATHPGHDLAARQQSGFGSLLSFELTGGIDAVRRFTDGLQIIDLAESLGGTESLLAHPATMTHAGMSPEARAAAGITDSLLRLSLGIEPVDDLLNEIRSALDRAVA